MCGNVYMCECDSQEWVILHIENTIEEQGCGACDRNSLLMVCDGNRAKEL